MVVYPSSPLKNFAIYLSLDTILPDIYEPTQSLPQTMETKMKWGLVAILSLLGNTAYANAITPCMIRHEGAVISQKCFVVDETPPHIELYPEKTHGMGAIIEDDHFSIVYYKANGEIDSIVDYGDIRKDGSCWITGMDNTQICFEKKKKVAKRMVVKRPKEPQKEVEEKLLTIPPEVRPDTE
jgi:hypothetical protein